MVSTSNHLFPQSAGMYFCQRDNELILIVIKGVCPVLKLDGGVDLGLYFRKRKFQSASKEILNNIEIFPEKWKFTPMSFVDYSVFSDKDNEFHPTGKLNIATDTMLDIREKYFYLCQQGVPATKIIRALVQEFKCSTDAIIELVNNFDVYANS